MQVLDCAEQNSDGRHGLMHFDIALHYHATIKAAQHEQRQIKNPEQDYYDRLAPPPVQTGVGMLTAKVVGAGSDQP